LLAVARSWDAQPLARVRGCSKRLAAPAAASMNSWQMHNQELPDIVVSAPPLIVRLVGRPSVANADPSYARLRLAFAAATALRKGVLDIADFRRCTQRRSDARARVRLQDDGDPDPNARALQSVSIRLIKGKLPITKISSLFRAFCRITDRLVRRRTNLKY